MRAADAELAMLRMHAALGQDVSEALIGWAKRAYVRDEITLEAMENVVAAILRGDENVVILEPGEIVIPLKGRRS